MLKLTFLFVTILSIIGSLNAGSSKENPGPFVNETWYAGTVPLSQTDDIFYWWFESRNSPKDDPVVLWLTGGPGCASEIALFFENGPYQFQDDQKTLQQNPHSWNEKANLVYVDQPVGTGFSKASVSDFDTNEDQIAENMAQFMIKFLEKFPELQGKDFYITGESYAGHYVPAISHNFLFKNKDNLKINFKGMAIGNGLVDPYLQYPAYNEFAKENGLIGNAQYYALKAGFATCQGLIKTGLWPVALEVCQLMVTTILGVPVAPRFNVYDIREKCEKPPLCYDLSATDNILARDDIKELLGVKGRSWTECNMAVHTALLGDWMVDLSSKVTDVLNSGVEVLVYSGDKDFICNWRGGEAWVHAVEWNGKEDFNKGNYEEWTALVSSKQTAGGSLKQFKNLKFLRVFNAGHMVPMNQPEAAKQMLQQFTSGGVHV